MTRKNAFFKGWSWLKFNNLGLTLSTNVKFYISVAKGLKLKVRMFWGLIPTFVEVAREKLVGGPFYLPPHPEKGKKCYYKNTFCFNHRQNQKLATNLYQHVKASMENMRWVKMVNCYDIFINETNDYVFFGKTIFTFKFTSVLFQETLLGKLIVFKEFS